MQDNFRKSLALVLQHEGGYVNHPMDKGGPTNKGVTQRTYDAYRRARNAGSRSVKFITDDEVGDIYRSRYWDVVRGDDLPWGVDYVTFDFAVNSGPSRAAQFLQRAVGTDDDGAIGPITLAAVEKRDPIGLINQVLDARMAWLRGLWNWGTFGRGWTNRVSGVRKAALAMAKRSEPVPVEPATRPLPPAPKITEDNKVVAPTGIGDFIKNLLAAVAKFFTTKRS